MLALCRLMLDNVEHVKTFWVMHSLPLSELALQFGADDIDGTVVWYDITKTGGSGTHQEVGVGQLRRSIRNAGFEPVERDTVYRQVRRHGKDWTVLGESGAREEARRHVGT
jgi:aminodeoxyfutalosine synthase